LTEGLLAEIAMPCHAYQTEINISKYTRKEYELSYTLEINSNIDLTWGYAINPYPTS